MTRHLDQRLNLQHLRCIEAIAAHGSLFKASAALGLTQPALFVETLRAYVGELAARGLA